MHIKFYMSTHYILLLMLLSEELICLTHVCPGQEEGVIWPCPSSDANCQGHFGHNTEAVCVSVLIDTWK